MTIAAADDLEALASYASTLYVREQRRLETPSAFRAEFRERWRDERARQREHAQLIAFLVNERRWLDVLDGLGWFGQQHMAFLDRAFPLMRAEDRAGYLRYVWCRCKMRPRIGLALRLFESATDLRSTVPADWPAEIEIYRGSWSHSGWRDPHRKACRWLRSGISWTTQRDVALRFTERLPGHVGVLGTSRVPRSLILAYFHDSDGDFGSYHEHECIVAPRSVRIISYERTNGVDGGRS